MTHVFEIGDLQRQLDRDPAGALQELLTSPAVDFIKADLNGIVGPRWDTKRERFLLRIEIAVPPVYDDGLPIPQQPKELKAACPGSVNVGGAANPPKAETTSAPEPAGSWSSEKSSRQTEPRSSRARSAAHTAESSTAHPRT